MTPEEKKYIITEEYVGKLDEYLSEHGLSELQRFQIRTRLKLEEYFIPTPISQIKPEDVEAAFRAGKYSMKDETSVIRNATLDEVREAVSKLSFTGVCESGWEPPSGANCDDSSTCSICVYRLAIESLRKDYEKGGLK